MKNIYQKIMLFLVLSVTYQATYTGDGSGGGWFAGGLITGAALTSMASQPRVVEREVQVQTQPVYIQQPRYSYAEEDARYQRKRQRQFEEDEIRARKKQRKIEELEARLDAAEQRAAQAEKKLNRKKHTKQFAKKAKPAQEIVEEDEEEIIEE